MSNNNDGEVAHGQSLVYGDRGLRVPRARKCRAAEADGGRLALRREVRRSIRKYVLCTVHFISTLQGLPGQSNKVWAEVHIRTAGQ